jgi:hypothetical protein
MVVGGTGMCRGLLLWLSSWPLRDGVRGGIGDSGYGGGLWRQRHLPLLSRHYTAPVVSVVVVIFAVVFVVVVVLFFV